MRLNEKRVHFVSQRDLLLGYYLHNLEEQLKDFDANIFVKEINDVVELHHIKKHIDSGNFLVKWCEDDVANYKDIVKSFPGVIVKYLRDIAHDKLFDEYQKLEWNYESTFWEIVANYNLLDLVDEDFLNKVLVKPHKLRILLQQKRLVDKFKAYFYDPVMHNPHSATILLDKYARTGMENGNDKDYFLPTTLTIEDKEQIIVDFLKQEELNLN